MTMQWEGGKGQKCLIFTGSLCLTSDLQKMWTDFQVSCGSETTAYHVIYYFLINHVFLSLCTAKFFFLSGLFLGR